MVGLKLIYIIKRGPGISYTSIGHVWDKYE